YSATMAWDSAAGELVLFGGISNQTGQPFFDETIIWNGSGWETLSPLSAPSGRNALGMIFDSDHNTTVLFGGNGIGGLNNETWLWTGFNWQQVDTAGPSARVRFGFAYDKARQKGVLFGGSDGGTI